MPATFKPSAQVSFTPDGNGAVLQTNVLVPSRSVLFSPRIFCVNFVYRNCVTLYKGTFNTLRIRKRWKSLIVLLTSSMDIWAIRDNHYPHGKIRKYLFDEFLLLKYRPIRAAPKQNPMLGVGWGSSKIPWERQRWILILVFSKMFIALRLIL